MALGCGVLYSLSVTSAAPPRFGTATLYADNVATPQAYPVRTIVPTPATPGCNRHICP